jgi:succinate dehydrogenase / fumarate reductase cytochrome b subunit
VIHIVYAFWLTIQNRKARGNSRYEVVEKPAKVEWASQNMLVLGIIVVLGMGLHLYNFWAKMMLVELLPCAGNHHLATNGVHWIKQTFSDPVYVTLYIVWLVALWFHLTHGFWSALQSIGLSGHIWFKRWRVIGNIFVTAIVLMFLAVVLGFACGLA